MDKSKVTKLCEMSMSGYLVGQSGFKKSMVKLKPQLKCGQYFLFAKDFKSPASASEPGNEIFIASEFVSGKIVLVHETKKKVLVKAVAGNVRPLGMAVIDHGKILAVVDEGSEVSYLKYYSRNDSGTLSLVECLTKRSDGNLVSCVSGGSGGIETPPNVAKDWRPKDVVETKSGNVCLCDASALCESRLTAYTPDGRHVTSFGRAFGPGDSTFVRPLHMAVDPFGRIFANDWENRNVQVFDGRGLWLNSIGRGSRYSGEGRLGRPGGLTCDGIGNVFVCDLSRSRLAMYSSGGDFIENIIHKARGTPTSALINSNKPVLAVSYIDNNGSFKKFSLSELPVAI